MKREQQLRWFGHIERMDDERAPVTTKKSVVNDSKRGRPEKSWKETIKKSHVGKKFEKNECSRPCCMEAMLQKPAHHHPWGKTSWNAGAQSLLSTPLEQMDDDI